MASPTHIDLTSPRRDEDGLGSTTPRVIPGDTTCTICLGRAFADPAAEPIFTWLICRHPLHLGCVADLRAHSQRPACLSCRQPWSMEGEVFSKNCAPYTESSFQTRPATRNTGGNTATTETTTRHFATLLPPIFSGEPGPGSPKGSLAGTARSQHALGPTFRSTQPRMDFRMELPSLQQHRHIGTRLASTHPSPTRVPTAWAQNLGHRLAQQRRWVCTRGTNIQTCTPTALPTATAEATYRPKPAIPHWLRQGPPGHSHLGPTNSWLYVPLLHAGRVD